MRPRYETSADLREELKAVERVLPVIGAARALKVPGSYRFDFVAVGRSGEVVAAVEVKRRRVPDGTYAGLILSAAKWASGAQFGREFGLPYVVVAALDDAVYVYRHLPDAEPPRFELRQAGRTDRADAADVEPCVVIPFSRFERAA